MLKEFMNYKGKVMIGLLTAEIILIAFFSLSGLRIKQEKKISDTVNIMMKQSDNGFLLPDHGQMLEEYTSVLQYKYHSLSIGTYTGIFTYQTHDVQELTFTSSTPQFLKANTIYLDTRQNKCVFYVTVTQPINDLTISINYKGDRYFSVEGMDYFQNPIRYLKTVFIIFSLFTIAEITLLIYFKKPESLKTLLAFVFISCIAFQPYLFDGIFPGHDFQFHFMRIDGLANELRNGQFPVYIESLWLTGYGSPVSIYYGDGLLYFPAFLRIIGFSFTSAFKIYVFLINFLTVVLSYYSFNHIFKNKTVAKTVSFVYVCSPYRFIQLYVRFAVGEFTAAAFFPLICTGYYGILSGAPISENGNKGFLNILKEKYYRNSIICLALGMTGVINTHLLSAEMAVFLLLIVSILLIKMIFTAEHIKAFVCSVILTLLLNAGFLVPFFDSYFSNDTVIKHSVNNTNVSLQSFGMQLGELFAFYKDIFGNGNNRSGLGDRIYLSIGFALMLIIFLAVYHLVRNRNQKRMFFFTAMSLVCLWFSSNLFPWDTLSRYSKTILMLANIQFSWRFLIFATLFAVMTFGELMIFAKDNSAYLLPGNIFSNKQIIFSLCFLVFCEFSRMTSNYAENTDFRRDILNTNEILIGVVDPAEYRRAGTDKLTLSDEILAENVSFSDVRRKGTRMTLVCKTGDEAGKIGVPIMNYKGYQVTDEYGNSYDIFDGKDKEISFLLPANFDGKITIRFQPLWYWTFAKILSVVVLFGLIGLLVWIPRKNAFIGKDIRKNAD